MVSLMDLDEDVLVQVLNKLSFVERISLSRVSIRMSEMVYSSWVSEKKLRMEDLNATPEWSQDKCLDFASGFRRLQILDPHVLKLGNSAEENKNVALTLSRISPSIQEFVNPYHENFCRFILDYVSALESPKLTKVYLIEPYENLPVIAEIFESCRTVTELTLHPPYHVPQQIFNRFWDRIKGQVTKLHVVRLNIPTSEPLSHLKELGLMHPSESEIRKLIDCCPNLESLRIVGRHIFLISQLKNLKSLRKLVWHDPWTSLPRAEILEFFTQMGPKLLELELTTGSFLHENLIDVITDNCPNLRRLYLHSKSWARRVETSQPVILPFLRKLRIGIWTVELDLILNHCPKLKELWVVGSITDLDQATQELITYAEQHPHRNIQVVLQLSRMGRPISVYSSQVLRPNLLLNIQRDDQHSYRSRVTRK